MKNMPNRSERGFTLIEIMIAAAIASVVIGALFGTMLMQQQTYMAQMEQAEASQNARASLDIIRQALRTAGWGMVSTTGGRGVPAVGTCYNATANLESTCNDLPALSNGTDLTPSDRVRFIGITGGTTFSRSTVWSGGSKLVVTDAGSPVTRTALQVGDLAVISGTCNDDSAAYNGVVKITNVNGSTTPWTYTFDGTGVTAYGYPAFGCTTMKDGFAFGLAHIVEFYIDRSLANVDHSAQASASTPQLMMWVNRGGVDHSSAAANNLTAAQPVAYNIESLQVRYGLDCGKVPVGNLCATATSPNADDIIDYVATGQQWCNDLRRVNCPTGLSDLDNQNRVMAVQVAVVPRTRNLARRILNDELHTTTGSVIKLFGTTILQPDGYKHWIYRSTIALRNNQLAVTGP